MERKKPRVGSKREYPIQVVLYCVSLGYPDFVARYKERCIWTISGSFHFDQTFCTCVFERENIETLRITADFCNVLYLGRKRLAAKFGKARTFEIDNELFPCLA